MCVYCVCVYCYAVAVAEKLRTLLCRDTLSIMILQLMIFTSITWVSKPGAATVMFMVVTRSLISLKHPLLSVCAILFLPSPVMAASCMGAPVSGLLVIKFRQGI